MGDNPAVGLGRQVSLKKVSSFTTRTMLDSRRSTAIAYSIHTSVGGADSDNGLPGSRGALFDMSASQLREILDKRRVSHFDLATKADLIRRIDETDREVSPGGKGMNDRPILATSTDFSSVDFSFSPGIVEMQKYLGTEEADLLYSDVKELANRVHQETPREKGNLDIIWPEYLEAEEARAIGEGDLDVTVHIPREDYERVERAREEQEGKTRNRGGISESFEITGRTITSGWMQKKGRTQHAMTRDYKRRWFELNGNLLTYLSDKPASEPGHQRNRSASVSVAPVLDSDTLAGAGTTSKSPSPKAGKDRQALIKGIVDFSIVSSLRPSQESGAPKFAIDLVTPSRVWVLAPLTQEDLEGWLRGFYPVVKREAIHDDFARLLQLPRREERQGVTSVSFQLPPSATVGDVVARTFEEFETRTGGWPISPDGPPGCMLKAAGFRDYMRTVSCPLAHYSFVAAARRERRPVKLALIRTSPEDVARVGAGLSEHESEGEDSMELTGSSSSSSMNSSRISHPMTPRGGASSSMRTPDVEGAGMGVGGEWGEDGGGGGGLPPQLPPIEFLSLQDMKWPFRVRVRGVQRMMGQITRMGGGHSGPIPHYLPVEMTQLSVKVELWYAGAVLPGCSLETTPAMFKPDPVTGLGEVVWPDAEWMSAGLQLFEIPLSTRVVISLFGSMPDDVEHTKLACISTQLIQCTNRLLSGARVFRMWNNLGGAEHGPCQETLSFKDTEYQMLAADSGVGAGAAEAGGGVRAGGNAGESGSFRGRPGRPSLPAVLSNKLRTSSSCSEEDEGEPSEDPEGPGVGVGAGGEATMESPGRGGKSGSQKGGGGG